MHGDAQEVWEGYTRGCMSMGLEECIRSTLWVEKGAQEVQVGVRA